MTSSRSSLPASRVAGVLFDIDDTLVDLERAMGVTLQSIPDPALAHLGADDWVAYKALYTTDPQRHYDRFLGGELSFEEQRVHRVRFARSGFTSEPFEGRAAEEWVRAYEELLPQHFEAFADVVPLLDALDARGIRYGAVSNNVYAYQRAKLDRAGLRRVGVLVGIDAVGVAKPDPAIFHEGARLLGASPDRTLYVGDNREIDAVGARSAGLIGIWLDRVPDGVSREAGERSGGVADDAAHFDARITGLGAVLQFVPSVR